MTTATQDTTAPKGCAPLETILEVGGRNLRYKPSRECEYTEGPERSFESTLLFLSL